MRTQKGRRGPTNISAATFPCGVFPLPAVLNLSVCLSQTRTRATPTGARSGDDGLEVLDGGLDDGRAPVDPRVHDLVLLGLDDVGRGRVHGHLEVARVLNLAHIRGG